MRNKPVKKPSGFKNKKQDQTEAKSKKFLPRQKKVDSPVIINFTDITIAKTLETKPRKTPAKQKGGEDERGRR